MKKIILSLILIPTLIITTSFNPKLELYSVIKVIGTIYSQDKDKNIDTGDEIDKNENFVFKTVDAKATVINPDLGRFIIQASAESDSKTDFIPPMSHQTRAFGDINNFKKYFMDGFAVVNECKVPISKNSFPQNDNNYFVVRYQLEDETIERKLSHENNLLIFNKEEIFMQDCTLVQYPKDNLVSLYYYKNGTYKYQTDFNLYFLNEELLKKEVTIILNSLKEVDDKKKSKEITDYIIDFYANTEQNHIEEWLHNNF